MNFLRTVVYLLLLAVASQPAIAKIMDNSPIYYAVIVNPKNAIKALKKQQLAHLFLKQDAIEDRQGQEIIPLDNKDMVTRALFYQYLLGWPIEQVEQYWQRQIFSGGAHPPKEYSIDDIMQKVEGKMNYLSYIPVESLYHPKKI